MMDDGSSDNSAGRFGAMAQSAMLPLNRDHEVSGLESRPVAPW